jgi:hypothetical protein
VADDVVDDVVADPADEAVAEPVEVEGVGASATAACVAAWSWAHR